MVASFTGKVEVKWDAGAGSDEARRLFVFGSRGEGGMSDVMSRQSICPAINKTRPHKLHYSLHQLEKRPVCVFQAMSIIHGVS